MCADVVCTVHVQVLCWTQMLARILAWPLAAAAAAVVAAAAMMAAMAAGEQGLLQHLLGVYGAAAILAAVATMAAAMMSQLCWRK
jgi:hypothetical protein